VRLKPTRPLSVAAAVSVFGALAACSATSPGPTHAPTTLATRTTESLASTTAHPPPTPSRSTPVSITGTPRDVVTGLDVPWSLAPLPDGSALVSLRDQHRILRIRSDGSKTALIGTGPDGSIPDVVPGNEGGLLGLAVSRAFSKDGRVYAYCTRESDNAVVVMTLTGDSLSAPRAIVTGIPKASNHNGGRIKFGPDGYLYVATGDATTRGDSQNPALLNGKILRVTTEGAPAPGNPFGTRVWSYGHRNVQGLGWAPDGTMYASEFGQNTWDELNRITPGANYGWPVVEGKGGGAGFTDPLVVWPTSEASPSGIAVTADAVYLAALRGQRLWRVPLEASGRVGEPRAFFTQTYGRLRDVVLAPGGKALWVLTNNTFRGTPKPGDDRVLEVPLG
jgi:glucose/arabinose dehydrogenase